jgi:hypothetical protein
MESDWEVELGGDAPVIEAHWAGFVDLRKEPSRVEALAEVQKYPALGVALQRLNASRSPVWTAKCDFWPRLEEGSWDADEMDALAGETLCAAGCYIDLLPAESGAWTELPQAEAACRSWCAELRDRPFACGRADLILRRVWMGEDWAGIGVTAYLTACGATESAAQQRLAEGLSLFAGILNSNSTVK